MYMQILRGGYTMAKDTSISVRMDSRLKEETEHILSQFGLNMTVVVNMLFNQIVREHAIPLSLTLNQHMSVADELRLAQNDRIAGNSGRTADRVADDMERIIAEAAYAE
jgi:addiction module RelB/DinJ family antitoxin